MFEYLITVTALKASEPKGRASPAVKVLLSIWSIACAEAALMLHYSVQICLELGRLLKVDCIHSFVGRNTVALGQVANDSMCWIWPRLSSQNVTHTRKNRIIVQENANWNSNNLKDKEGKCLLIYRADIYFGQWTFNT